MIAAILAFFAADPEAQHRLLPELPRDRGIPDFYSDFAHNPLFLLAQGLLQLLASDDARPDAEFLTEVGLPEDWEATALPELAALLDLMRADLDHENLYTQRALTSKVPWRLVRRLARQAQDDLQLGAGTSAAELSEVLADLRRRAAD